METFEVQSVNCNVSPKAYKINSGKKITIQPSAYILSNVSDEITAEVSIIGDNEKVLYKAEDKKIGGENLKEVIFGDFTYVPDIKDTTIVRVQTKILRKGVEQKTKNNYVKIYSSTDENRVDIDYKVSSNFIDTTTDNINVDFSLSGKVSGEKVWVDVDPSFKQYEEEVEDNRVEEFLRGDTEKTLLLLVQKNWKKH